MDVTDTVTQKLVPTQFLFESLEPNVRERFDRAIKLIDESLLEKCRWQDIAKQCQISEAHFHKQFSELFAETPGQFITRKKLRLAVEILLFAGDVPITEVAQHIGYSSSQALAKALMRELNLTAKQIKAVGKSGSSADISKIFSRLSHPTSSNVSEYQLAENLSFQIDWYPQRFLAVMSDKLKKKREHDPANISDKLLYAVELFTSKDIEYSWAKTDYKLGTWTDSTASSSTTLKEGFYASMEVFIESLVGADAAWNALLMFIKDSGYQIDEHADGIEQIIALDKTKDFALTIRVELPVYRKG
ncbi:hypothetical protein SOPP22_18850 [Shewanella sp. OPT22]|nr:hypothetical protein SOPP22_18850 [Shewanella sp. OPT22]